MRQLIIGDRIISDDSNAYVIAESGHNHQGSLKTAKELFQAAADCGVDAGKLQKRDNRSLYTREMYEKCRGYVETLVPFDGPMGPRTRATAANLSLAR